MATTEKKRPPNASNTSEWASGIVTDYNKIRLR